MLRTLHAAVGAVFLLALAGAFTGCTTMQAKREDPLIGRIHDTRTGMAISYTDLFSRIERTDVVYLGENHDNAEHHEIQMRIIRDLAEAGKKPQLGFEFFSIEQTGYLTAYVRAGSTKGHRVPEDVVEQRLRRVLGWQDRSDREWDFYFGLLKLARELQLKVFGADLPAGVIRGISRNGIDGISPVESQLIRSTEFVDEDYRELMYNKFKASHCGFAMERHQKKMYQAWLARNDTMARSISTMAAADGDRPVVVILGGGHTEHDMGVFERVAFLQPDLKQLNIGLQEIYRRPAPLEAYLEQQTVNQRRFLPSHQYLWFTQRHSYEDPCERFKEHLSAMKKARQKQ